MKTKEILAQLTLEEKASLCSGYDFWNTQAIKRLNIPKAMMSDGPNGLRKQEEEGDHLGIKESIKTVCFPTSSAIASSFDRELAKNIGEVLGEECRAEGVAMLLGPGVNIKRSPLCGRNFEYYSEDPYLSSTMAAAFINGVQSKGVGSCIKHFAANNQETLRMSSNSVVDERTLNEIYLASFESAIKEGKPKGVMCSYNKLNGTYLAENKELLTDRLREKWGFEGLVVTDWGAVKDRVKGLSAGLDLEMPGGPNAIENTNKIVNSIKNGELSEEALDKSVARILEFVLGSSTYENKQEKFDRKHEYQESLRAAKESAVLLKNDNDLLPLKRHIKVAYVGEFAKKPRYQGNGSSYINSINVSTPLQEIKKYGEANYSQGYSLDSDETDYQLLEEAVAAAKESDCVVCFAGLPNSFETEGKDRVHLDLPKNQNHLIEELCKVQENVIVVLYNGAPVTMPWINKVSSVLEMHLSGDGVGEATMSLLFGESNPCGKLAETYPIKLEDNPSYLFFPGDNGIAEYREGIYVGYRFYDKTKRDVLFPFGHGLSYTEFEYSNLKLNKDEITDKETIEISVDIQNKGKFSGKEVVQLYVGSINSSVSRPLRELKEFAKIELAQGEKKTIKFTLDKRAFSFYDVDEHDWSVDSGDYLIQVGSSSRDIRLEKSLTVKSTKLKKIVFTYESTVGQLMSSPKGNALMAQLKAGSDSKQNSDALGEGSQEMAKAMMVEMPLSSLVNFGAISQKQLDELITMLNEE